MKNKSFFPILLLATIFAISGCNNAQPQPSSYDDNDSSSSFEPEGSSSENSSQESSSQPSSSSEDSSGGEGEKTGEIEVEMDASLTTNESRGSYKLTLNYDDELFKSSAKIYDVNLSSLSFAASIATATKERGTKFFTDIDFENITSHAYDSDPTNDSIGYFMAHKSIDEFELVTVAFRGFNYGLEWANNFVIGKTGNHEGFNARGEEVYQDLQSYINTYAKDKTLKLWINGYSRAGALSNVLSSLILKGDKVNVTQDNMFVYTFEAPASLSEENAVAYQNVHNIINEADLIASIPPVSYGLKRCGVDHQIYDANVSTLVKQFDEDIAFPEFVSVTADNPLNSDNDVRDFLLNSVFNKEENGSDPTIYANTREQYVDNYQDGLSSSIGYIFALKAETRSELIEALKTSAMSILSDETGEELYKFIKPYLDRDNVTYVDEKLHSDCAILIKAVGNLFITVLFLYYLSSDFANDLTRLINMHYPETTYVLLNNAHNKE